MRGAPTRDKDWHLMHPPIEIDPEQFTEELFSLLRALTLSQDLTHREVAVITDLIPEG